MPISATRQCVCGGWTRYIVCQYCGTTDPHAAAAGMISMTPLVQRSPEEAAAHSAGASTSSGYDGGGAHWEPGTQPAMPSFSEAGTHAAPPLPPTTFAEAQFGEAPSAAAAFASNADLPTSGAFSTPTSDSSSAFTGSAFAKAPAAPAAPSASFAAPAASSAPETAEPVAYTEPIPGWSDAPVPAPPGWATAAPAPFEPGGAAPAPLLSAFDTPAAPSAEETPASGPAPVSYPTPPSSYEMPAELAAQQPAPQPTETVDSAPQTKAAKSKSPKAKAPKSKVAKVEEPREPTLKPVGGAKRPLPRWTVPALAAVVVLGAGGLYLGTRGGSDTSSAPIVVHKRPVTAASAAVAPTAGTAPASTVAPATRLANAAPQGYAAAAPGVSITGAALATADSIHRSTELAAAGVTSATVTTFSGPGGVKITALTETAASPAQAAALATHARHLGFTVQASNGTTVFSLHSLGNAPAVVAALTSWSKALQG